MVNRRLFVTNCGKVIKTSFDVYWYAVDKNGDAYLYGCAPLVYGYIWYERFIMYYVKNFGPTPQYKSSRWFLNGDGEWVKM